MRFASGTLVLMHLILSCSSQPKDEIVPASLQETSAPVAAAAPKAEAADCSDDSFCTREYIPTICQFSGQSFEGSNPCEAKKLARRFACEKRLSFSDSAVSCESKAKGTPK